MTKKALGKGLGAFIPEEFSILKEERYAEVGVEEIRPNPYQPRLKFEETSIEELAASIRESGVVQPVLVVPEENHYKIIVGERRWRAAQKAGLKKIPVLIRNLAPEKQIEVSIIENIHREELGPLEIARAFQRLISERSYTQQELAEKVGKDRASVSNYIRLLKLPKEIQVHVDDGKLSMGHARALLALDEPAAQLHAAKMVLEKNLSVRNTEKLVDKMKDRAPRVQRSLADPDLHSLQEELLKLLGTKVLLSGNRNKGVVKIYYFSLEELNRIYDQIKGGSA